MTRDEIYDHLAQVYLGKRKGSDIKKKRQLNAWLIINICITGLIFFSVFYGLTAFLTQQRPAFENSIIFPLHNGPLFISYNFNDDFLPVNKFALDISSMNIAKFKNISFSVRAKEEGSPGILKVVFENRFNEKSFYYVRGIDLSWKEVTIPFNQFEQITDWESMKEVSFVLESWNVNKKKGVILIDEVQLSS